MFCGDCNADGQVTVDEIVKAVDRALSGCQNDGTCPQSGGLQVTGQTTSTKQSEPSSPRWLPLYDIEILGAAFDAGATDR